MARVSELASFLTGTTSIHCVVPMSVLRVVFLASEKAHHVYADRAGPETTCEILPDKKYNNSVHM